MRSARHTRPVYVHLCATRQGVAHRCTCCGRVEVAFGNVLLSLDGTDLDQLLAVLAEFEIRPPAGAETGQRGFLIRTIKDRAAFAFNRTEVTELRALLEAARRALKARSVSRTPAVGPPPNSNIVH